MRTHMKGRITRILAAVAAACATAVALAVTGGAAGATTPTTGGLGPPVYTSAWAGYQAGGRWFRFVSTTLTVPPTPASPGYQEADVALIGANPGWFTDIFVVPGGGPGSVSYQDPQKGWYFNLSPNVGDKMALSIYYDRHGHVYLTAADLTQGKSQTVRARVDNPVYTSVWLRAGVDNTAVTPPPADVRLWEYTVSHVTTYTGTHGTVLGPWTAQMVVDTTTGTAQGQVVTSPSSLWNAGQNFGVWLRAERPQTAKAVNNASDTVTRSTQSSTRP
jgi:hypothetical protein